MDRLIEVLDGHVGRRSLVLKARSALVSLRTLSRELANDDPSGAEALAAEVERVEASAHELAELRLLHLLFTGAVDMTEDEHREIDRLTSGGEPAERLGVEPDESADVERATALARLEAWRTRATHPLTDRVTAEACEIVAHSYERLFARLTATDARPPGAS